MSRRERSHRAADGRELLLRSERTITADGESWELKLELFGPGNFGRRLRKLDSRILRKSGQWSTAAIELLQAQEEFEILRGAGVEVDLMAILRG